MSGGRVVVLEITRIEAAHLSALVEQFSQLLESTEELRDDPAIARLVPDAYPDDVEAAREFRSLTEGELLANRRADSARVITMLAPAADLPDAADEDALMAPTDISLDPADVGAWLRTIAAVRLVLASRLGIRSEDDHDDDDPRFGIYDWLGFRLDGLVRAAED